ncbi:MAG: CPBP family intramembrane glutamic endopeptidase [Thermoanaerobaculia bacterium]
MASFAGVKGTPHPLLARIDRIATPLAIFLSVYLVVLVLPLFAFVPGQPLFHWIALAAVAAATVAGRAVARDRHPLGFPLTRAPLELLFGVVVAVFVVGGAHALLVASGDVEMRVGSGFPLTEVVLLHVPVVLHEELLFRGWPFQHLLRWNRAAAVLISSAVFAALHLGNAAVSLFPLVNLFLGGVLLAYGYLFFERMWVPIGAHFAWNLLAGPLLGYEVSGHLPSESLALTIDRGTVLMTGGDFGIEGSVVITLLQIVALAALAAGVRRRDRNSAARCS